LVVQARTPVGIAATAACLVEEQMATRRSNAMEGGSPARIRGTIA